MDDFVVIREFPDDYRSGHFVFVGRTGSGKTYYAKYVIRQLGLTFPHLDDGRLPVYAFAGAQSAHDWRDLEADGSTVVPAANVFTEWGEHIYKPAIDEIRTAGRGILVFDDFKSVFNYHGDESFKNFVRVLRHLNCQMMMLVHSCNDVPPVVRANVDHVILASTSNLAMMKELADNYLGGDSHAIRKAFAQLGSVAGRPMLKLNVRNNTRSIHSAPPPSQSGINTSAVGTAAGEFGGDATRIGGDTSIGMRSAAVNGVYNDASTNVQNVTLNTSIQAQIAQNKLNLAATRERAELSRELEVEGVRHSSRLKRLQNRETLRELLLSPYLATEDRDRAAALLAQELGDSSITPWNMWDGSDRRFMAAHFPEINYAGRSRGLAAATTYAPLATAAVRADANALVGEAIKAAGGNGIRGALGWLGIANRPADTPPPATPGARAREAARSLIVFRPDRHRGWFTTSGRRGELIAALRGTLRDPSAVNEKNVVAVGLEMLQEYYPADYADELAIARDKHRRQTAAADSSSDALVPLN